MMARGSERGASTSPLEAVASAVSVIAGDFPGTRELSLSTLNANAISSRRLMTVAGLYEERTAHNASALLDFPD